MIYTTPAWMVVFAWTGEGVFLLQVAGLLWRDIDAVYHCRYAHHRQYECLPRCAVQELLDPVLRKRGRHAAVHRHAERLAGHPFADDGIWSIPTHPGAAAELGGFRLATLGEGNRQRASAPDTAGQHPASLERRAGQHPSDAMRFARRRDP